MPRRPASWLVDLAHDHERIGEPGRVERVRRMRVVSIHGNRGSAVCKAGGPFQAILRRHHAVRGDIRRRPLQECQQLRQRQFGRALHARLTRAGQPILFTRRDCATLNVDERRCRAKPRPRISCKQVRHVVSDLISAEDAEDAQGAEDGEDPRYGAERSNDRCLCGCQSVNAGASRKKFSIIARSSDSDCALLTAVRSPAPPSSPLVYQPQRARSLLITQRSWREGTEATRPSSPGDSVKWGLSPCSAPGATCRKPAGSWTRSFSSNSM